jgi:hypothetical protein
MSATEQHANITFFIMLPKSLPETLRTLEEARGEAAMVKTQFTGGMNVDLRVPKTIHTTGDTHCLFRYELIPERLTVNKDIYFEILHRPRDGARRKRPWALNSWFLVQDIAPAHRSLVSKSTFPSKM